MRTYACAAGLIALTGCASQPTVITETIRVPTYIKIPDALVEPVKVDLTGATWGSAVGDLNNALQICNSKLEAIATLKPPGGPF